MNENMDAEMEKKIIDLSKETGNIEIILPKGWKLRPHSEVIEITAKDPFDLVPKNYRQILSELKPYEIAQIAKKDAKAFDALKALRVLWHEWVKILGEPKWGAEHTIRYERDTCEFVSYPSEGILTFKEQSHAEKFIECFPELLEKAKILL